MIIASVILVGFFVLLGLVSASPKQNGAITGTTSTNQTSDSGEQILEITAKGGYKPSEMTAKAGQPILLRVNTKSTYDCSASFTIPKFGINQILPADGITDFKIPAQTAGTEIQGSCSMRMYFFKIKVV